MRTSKGRHGGGGGKTDKGELANQKKQASLNTDTDSLAENRNLSGEKAKGKAFEKA